MKKTLFLIGISLCTLVACDQQKSKTEAEAASRERDSLQQIISQQEGEINDMIATLNEISEGFRDISLAENRVSTVKEGDASKRKELIKENMQFIQNTMKQNRELIAKLKKQLNESSVKSTELERTIDNLTAQLQQKDDELKQLRAELEAKNIHIAELDTQIEGLNTEVTSLTQEGEKKSDVISQQDKELNTAYYVYGTKSELKEHNVLIKKKVLQGDFDKSYFTKIDIRTQKEIKLYSKSADILTNHPADSYTLQQDANKQYVLRITDPQLFWSTSKYLVVQVK